MERQAIDAGPGGPSAHGALVSSLNRLAWLLAAQSDVPDAERAYDEAILSLSA